MINTEYICPDCGARYIWDSEDQRPCCDRKLMRAEIERLRKALREAAETPCPLHDEDAACELLRKVVNTARAALAGTDPAIPSRQGDGGADEEVERLAASMMLVAASTRSKGDDVFRDLARHAIAEMRRAV